jgi:vitamin B12 transport system permease protein
MADQPDAPRPRLLPANPPARRSRTWLPAAEALLAAAAGAAVWVAIAAWTHSRAPCLAVAVGLIVALTVRALGSGNAGRSRLIAAAATLFACLLAHALISSHAIASQYDVAWIEPVRAQGFRQFGRMLLVNAHPTDVLFWALAAYAAYRYARGPAARKRARRQPVRAKGGRSDARPTRA